jgi:hypothetical protein
LRFHSIQGERGTAVLVALLLLTLVGAVAAALVAISTMETIISARYRHAQETAFGAEAAFELALRDLSVLPDWSRVLATPPGNLMSPFDDGEVMPRGPDGRTLDLAGMTTNRQRESDTRLGTGFGGDSPRWRLFVHATPRELRARPDISVPLYFVVWVSDDESDSDGDPAIDSNGRILLYALAVGSGGARRSVEGRISRTVGGDIRLEGLRQGR